MGLTVGAKEAGGGVFSSLLFFSLGAGGRLMEGKFAPGESIIDAAHAVLHKRKDPPHSPFPTRLFSYGS